MLYQEPRFRIKITPVLPNDVDAVEKLYFCSVRCNPRGFIQDLRYHSPIHTVFSDYRENGGDLLVAKVENHVVGMGGLRRISNDRIELCKLHISRYYQGKGYGTQLVYRLLARARELGVREVELHVTKTQTIAIHIYKKVGFSTTKENVFIIETDGKQYAFDTIYMEKKLA
jgi:putative acetyltransferase